MSRNAAVHTEIYKGYRIEIFPDEDAGNPYEEWDQAGKAICFHNRYNLGTKHDFKTPRDFMESLVDEDDLKPTDFQKDDIDIEELDDSEVQRLAEKRNLIFPVYLYDHSGITIRMSTGGNPFTCRWDSGQVGWVYISFDDIRKEWGDPADPEIITKATNCLKSEIETFDDYLTGRVYGYVVSKNVSPPDTDEDEIEWEEVESCWGYYGWYDDKDAYIMSEAKSIADHLEKKDLPLLAAGGVLKENEAPSA